MMRFCYFFFQNGELFEDFPRFLLICLIQNLFVPLRAVNNIKMKEIKICVIGLGYVGLPLARLFSTKYPTVGFDMNPRRVEALMAGHDATLEVSDELLQDAINNHGFRCTANIDDIRDCNFYVGAVPAPVDINNNPDLTPLYGASETVGKHNNGGIFILFNNIHMVAAELFPFVVYAFPAYVGTKIIHRLSTP